MKVILILSKINGKIIISYNIGFYRLNRGLKGKKIPFEIDVNYLESILNHQNTKCFYFGIEMSLNRAGKYSASIDRIDSSKVYIKGNVVFVISAVNTMKNDLEENEFLKIIEAIYKKQSSDF